MSRGPADVGMPGEPAAAPEIALPPSARGNLVRDAHLATVLLLNRLLKLCTQDKNFRRFDFLAARDPLQRAAAPADRLNAVSEAPNEVILACREPSAAVER